MLCVCAISAYCSQVNADLFKGLCPDLLNENEFDRYSFKLGVYTCQHGVSGKQVRVYSHIIALILQSPYSSTLCVLVWIPKLYSAHCTLHTVLYAFEYQTLFVLWRSDLLIHQNWRNSARVGMFGCVERRGELCHVSRPRRQPEVAARPRTRLRQIKHHPVVYLFYARTSTSYIVHPYSIMLLITVLYWFAYHSSRHGRLISHQPFVSMHE